MALMHLKKKNISIEGISVSAFCITSATLTQTALHHLYIASTRQFNTDATHIQTSQHTLSTT